LKVVFPATPYDAKGLMNACLAGTDPVVFFESQRIYDQPELFRGTAGVPEGYYEITLGDPDVKREGSDLTILTVGATLYRALEAANVLEAEYGISTEIIDARTLVPFQYEKVIESVKKTGRILLCSDACERGSILQQFAAKIGQFCFNYLDAPPIVLGARNWVTPPDEVEDAFFPFPADILDAIHTHILPLPGYTVGRVCDTLDLLRRSREGV
jgi:2-oxoisovalerate dehydrogenase E1 component